jgi:hypothetical protein
VLLNSPHFCKKVYYYLNPIGEVKWKLSTS